MIKIVLAAFQSFRMCYFNQNADDDALHLSLISKRFFSINNEKPVMDGLCHLFRSQQHVDCYCRCFEERLDGC